MASLICDPCKDEKHNQCEDSSCLCAIMQHKVKVTRKPGGK